VKNEIKKMVEITKENFKKVLINILIEGAKEQMRLESDVMTRKKSSEFFDLL